MQFFLIYIKEAHAIDSQRPSTARGQPIVQEPVTWKERAELAQTCTEALDLKEIPTLIDGIKDGVGEAYAAWPDRLYLVGRNGRIVYGGGRGPRGFKPEELDAAIRAETQKQEKRR